MAEKDLQFSSKLKQTGIFDFKKFYKFVYSWLSDSGYAVVETKYSEKVSNNAKDIDISWEASKKISDYFEFKIKIGWSVSHLTNIKVKKEGKEIDMNSGEVGISFKAILIKDYEDRWENAPVWKFLRGIYDRYIIKSRIEGYSDKLIEEIDELIAQCKSFLVLEAKK